MVPFLQAVYVTVLVVATVTCGTMAAWIYTRHDSTWSRLFAVILLVDTAWPAATTLSTSGKRTTESRSGRFDVSPGNLPVDARPRVRLHRRDRTHRRSVRSVRSPADDSATRRAERMASREGRPSQCRTGRSPVSSLPPWPQNKLPIDRIVGIVGWEGPCRRSMPGCSRSRY